jgi:hypothetical protein
MNNPVLITVIVLHVVAILDAWTSRLTRPAKTIWSATIIFLPVVGLAAWILTRSSAHQPLEELPVEEAPVAAAE